MLNNLICIKSFTNREEAEIAAGLLRASGIGVDIFIDNCGGIHPELDSALGIRLMVSEEDKEVASDFLRV